MKNLIISAKQIAKRTCIAYGILLLVFYFALVLASLIPSKNITNNISASVPLLLQEGDYPLLGGQKKIYQLDNFTDSYILNIIYNIDNSNPFISPLMGLNFSSDTDDSTKNSKSALLAELIEDKKLGNSQYPRYWHGYITYLRPLLLIFNLSEIRFFYQILFFLLITIIVIRLVNNFSKFISLGFVLSLSTINFLIIPFSLQFSSVFFITFLGMIFLMRLKNFSFVNLTMFFFVIGAITSYFDFLTTPIITFGLPAIIVVLREKEKTEKNSLPKAIGLILGIGFFWILGYSLLWLSKWVLSSLLLKQDILSNGFNAVLARTGGVIPSWLNDGRPLFLHSLEVNWSYYFDNNSFVKNLIIIATTSFLGLFIFYHVNKDRLKISAQLLLISLTPYVWFIFASNHSAIHVWFTYRIQIITCFALVCMIFYSVDWNRIRSDFLKLNKKKLIKS